MTTAIQQRLDPEFAQQPTSIIQYAIERGAGIETIKELIALKREEEADQARKAYHDAMAEFKQNAPEITKNKKVDFTTKSGSHIKYSHATLDHVCEQVVAGLARVGITHKWIPKQSDGKVQITCILTHRLGYSDPEPPTLSGPPDESGTKNPVQAIASTVTFLERYTLLAAVGLAAKDQDTDGRAPVDTSVTEKQEAELQDYADALRQCDSLPQLKNIFADAYKYAGTVNAHAKSEMARVYEECKRRLQ